MTNGEATIRIAHGFGQLALNTAGHTLEGKLGCFLGDRTVTTFNGEDVVQDPDFVVLKDPTDIRSIGVKPANDGSIKKMTDNGELLKGNARVEIDIPVCLPLPLAWAPYFLERQRTNKEAYLHMSKEMAKWTGPDEIRLMVVGWFRAACTRGPISPECSLVDISTRNIPKEQDTIQWTLAHLQGVVPRPAPRTVSPSIASATATPRTSSPHNDNVSSSQQTELHNRILALTDHILTSKVEREKPSETNKTLSEAELCKLLGFCGLSWQDRDLLPSIWTDLKKQPDRASRETVLAAFFDDIALKEKSLRHFKNHALIDDIINHRFDPGDTHDTCHKGFSPLAMLPRTHSDIFEEKTTEAIYNEGKHKTLTEIKRHRTKGPPAIPLNDAEFIRLNSRDVAILTAFFTPWSSLVQQEQELHDELLDQQTDLFSHMDFTRKMIPQILWAKITARRKFFSQTCTKKMVDPPDGAPPKLAKATLSAHSLLILSGTEIKIVGVPAQWLAQVDGPGPAKRARNDNTARHDNASSATDNHHRPSRPDQRSSTSATPWEGNSPRHTTHGGRGLGTNDSFHPIFAELTELRELLRKHPTVQLGMVAEAAGFTGTGALPTAGLPPDSCLKWIAFGKCSYAKCERAHPATVDDTAACNLYRAMLPGVNAINAMDALPPSSRPASR
jgi:hypothetical protein